MQPSVTPVGGRGKPEGVTDQGVPVWVVEPKLFTGPNRAVVPVVHAVAIKVRLSNFRPVFTGIAGGVGTSVKPFFNGRFVDPVQAICPGRLQTPDGAVDGMAKLVDGNAFVVIAIQWQREQVFLAKAGGASTGPAHSFVNVRGVWVCAILWHVGVKLILANHNQVHAVFDHGLKHVGSPCQQVRNNFVSPHQGLVGYHLGPHNGQAGHRNAFGVERPGRGAVGFVDQVKEGRGRWSYGGRVGQPQKQEAGEDHGGDLV